ncbi:MAG: hypothetical protein WA908_10245 [Pontixanthobacter sp.]
MLKLTRNRPVSKLALAVALATGTALTGLAFESPAAAQDKEKEAKPDYSKGFVEAYSAATKLMSAEPADIAGATAAIPTVMASVSTPDDKLAAGQLMVNIGQTTSDDALLRRGLDTMLDSGRVPADRQTTYLVNSGDLARKAGDFDMARERFNAAHAAGHVRDDLPPIIASTYFEEDRYQEGVAYLRGLIDAEIAANRTPTKNWLEVAFSSAYNNDMALDAINLAALNVRHYPNETNWRNAIGVQRNLVDMTDDITLDLMRLSKRTGTLTDGRDYADYIEAADPRRLPGEVETLLDEAIAKGVLEANDPFVADAQQTVDSRLAADRADLGDLERDAAKSDASAVTASAAGDVFLSYGEAAKAERFYTAAIDKPNANTDRVLTRLGIAQADQGKYAEADKTFQKVSGQRSAIAALWRAYVASKMNTSSAPATMSM